MAVPSSTLSRVFSRRQPLIWLVWPLLLVASSFPLVKAGSAAASNFTASDVPLYPRQVVCPSDSELMGYVSIKDINLDIQRAVTLVSPPSNHRPQDRYVYTICPNTVLHGGPQAQLTPLLHNSNFVCGRHGHSGDNCRIQHGLTQVLIVDAHIVVANPTTNLDEQQQRHDIDKLFVFRGLTFSHSEDISVAAVASSTTRAEFYDCHWKKGFRQSASIMVALGQAVPTPFAVPDMVYRLADSVNAYSLTQMAGIEHNVFQHFERSEHQEADYGLQDHPTGHSSWLTRSFWHSDSNPTATANIVFDDNTDQVQDTLKRGANPMTVYLEDSTFTMEDDHPETMSQRGSEQHSSTSEQYAAKPLFYRPIFNTGHVHLKSVSIGDHQSSSSSTRWTPGSSTPNFAINVVQGSALVEDCAFSNNHLSAVIRAIEGSEIVVQRSTFSNNQVVGTIAAVGYSNLTLDQSYLEDNQVSSGQLLLYDHSEGNVRDSCFVSTTSTDYFNIVVDQSSHLWNLGNNFAGTPGDATFTTSTASSNLRSGNQQLDIESAANVFPSTSICPPGEEAHILYETSQGNCFRPYGEGSGNKDDCEGYCVSFGTQTCPLPGLWFQAKQGNGEPTNAKSSSSAPSFPYVGIFYVILISTTTIFL